MLILVMKSFFVTLNRTRSRILECIYEVNFLFERIKYKTNVLSLVHH